jgi:hypothetical protein
VIYDILTPLSMGDWQSRGRKVQYRIYLIGGGNRIRAAESFIANDDREATEVAIALYGSCSTTFESAELWRGTELVMRQISDGALATGELRQLIDRRQESVARLEEMLERSFVCVRESRQLMAALDTIRGR